MTIKIISGDNIEKSTVKKRMKLKIYLYFIYIYMLKNSCNLRIEKTTFLIFKNYKNWLNKLIILLEIWNNRFNEKSIFYKNSLLPQFPFEERG